MERDEMLCDTSVDPISELELFRVCLIFHCGGNGYENLRVSHDLATFPFSFFLSLLDICPITNQNWLLLQGGQRSQSGADRDSVNTDPPVFKPKTKPSRPVNVITNGLMVVMQVVSNVQVNQRVMVWFPTKLN